MEQIAVGWTFDQWAEAFAWYRRNFGVPDASTMNGILKVRLEWKKSRISEPGEIKLFGVEVERDCESATRVFSTIPSFVPTTYSVEPG